MSELSPLFWLTSTSPNHVCVSAIEVPCTVSQYVPDPSTTFDRETVLKSSVRRDVESPCRRARKRPERSEHRAFAYRSPRVRRPIHPFDARRYLLLRFG